MAAVGGQRRPNALGDPPPGPGQVQRGKSGGTGRESWEELADCLEEPPVKPRQDQPGDAYPIAIVHLTWNLQMSHVARLSSRDACTSPYAQSMPGSMLSYLELIF